MDVNTELILIRITGLDRPGLTASFTEILSAYDVTILDIGQADIHRTLSLGILFKSHKSDSGNIMKELLFKASDIGVNIQFAPVSVEEYEGTSQCGDAVWLRQEYLLHFPDQVPAIRGVFPKRKADPDAAAGEE